MLVYEISKHAGRELVRCRLHQRGDVQFEWVCPVETRRVRTVAFQTNYSVSVDAAASVGALYGNVSEEVGVSGSAITGVADVPAGATVKLVNATSDQTIDLPSGRLRSTPARRPPVRGSTQARRASGGTLEAEPPGTHLVHRCPGGFGEGRAEWRSLHARGQTLTAAGILCAARHCGHRAGDRRRGHDLQEGLGRERVADRVHHLSPGATAPVVGRPPMPSRSGVRANARSTGSA